MTAGYKVIVISEKNNIRDGGGSTAVQTTYTVDTVHTAYAVYTMETALRC